MKLSPKSEKRIARLLAWVTLVLGVGLCVTLFTPGPSSAYAIADSTGLPPIFYWVGLLGALGAIACALVRFLQDGGLSNPNPNPAFRHAACAVIFVPKPSTIGLPLVNGLFLIFVYFLCYLTFTSLRTKQPPTEEAQVNSSP